ncbi:MAG: ABC transporter ATP-binding protein/permease [Candidatus Omnitrophica bacterium]|nr:ABC transporter ATP-binding protein/permease [Candidatus Omnitrophota bacterium]
MAIISIKNISKTFHSKSKGKFIRALDGVSFDVLSQEILGILGPNGAGKTTLLNILSTLLIQDTGQIYVNGLLCERSCTQYMRMIMNMASGYPNFAWSLTVEENLSFYAKLYGLSGAKLKSKKDEVIELLQLKPYQNQCFDELSSGTKQRMALAKALLNNPKILFLDEPTIGLDPDVAVNTRRMILDIWKEKHITILLTTHNMKEAELMCQRIVFLKQGRVIRIASPGQLKQMHQKDTLDEVFISLARDHEYDFSQQPIKTEALCLQSAETTKAEIKNKLAEHHRLFAWINRASAFTYRNFIFAKRNFFSFAELLFWPMVTLISIGLMGNFLSLEHKALAFIMTGAITGGILQLTQLDVSYNILYEIWSKSLKHTMLTPAGPIESLCGSWIIGIVRGLIIFSVLAIAAYLMFGVSFPGIIPTSLFLMGIFLTALIAGTIVNMLVLAFGNKAENTAWMLAYLLMLICGIYYPVETLPVFWHRVSQFIPLTYFLEYLRSYFGFAPSGPFILLKGFALTGLYLFVEIIFLKYFLNQARLKGVIVKLSE